jgi:DNA-binding response OmpR family regulator
MEVASVAVLLVEDDPALGAVLVESLSFHGHQPSLAESAAVALGLLSETHNFQVMVLDLQLGDKRGEELVEDARALGRRIPPVLIHSAQPITELQRAAASIRAHAILQKPCPTPRMLDAIRKAVA